jgi:hypothetical protein
MFVSDLEAAVGRVLDMVAIADPEQLSGADATKVVALFSSGKRACEAGMALFAERVNESGAYAESGHRSAAEWLGHLAGESSGRAKTRLETAQRMKELPELGAAVRRAEVSNDQAQVIADAATLDPSALPRLLDASADDSFAELKEKAAKVRQAALSEEEHQERQARVHRERHIRDWLDPTGGARGGFSMPEATWGRILGALDPMTDRIFKAARESGERESRDAYRVDALVALLTGSGPAAGGGVCPTCGAGTSKGVSPGAMVHLRVDAESLLRGAVEGDEVCEIKGVGPVPVSVARSLLPDCAFQVLVRKGSDVVNVTGKGHYIPDRLRSAVHERDGHCRWPNCTSTVGLQIHHWKEDVARGGKTILSDLAAFCIVHHDKFTYGGWRADLSEDGIVRVFPPEEGVSLARLERRRRQMKLDAARSRAAKRRQGVQGGGRRSPGKTGPASTPEQRPPSRT